MIFFATELVSIVISLWKYLRLTTWFPNSLVGFIRFNNETRSILWTEVKLYCLVHVRCAYSLCAISHRWLVTVDDSSDVGSSGYFHTIENI